MSNLRKRYQKEEQETVISTDALANKWVVYTTQPTMLTKVRKLKSLVILDEELNDEGRVISGTYELEISQVSFRNLLVLSDEEKKKRSEAARARFAKK